MKMRRKNRAATLLLATWPAVMTAAVPLAGATPDAAVGTAMPATVATVAAGCDAQVSCGAGCTADFTHGFCVLAADWDGSLSLGGWQLLPSFSVSCHICECWYSYLNADGNRLLKRTTSLGCEGGFSGIEILE